jgi:hypothetical protein
MSSSVGVKRSRTNPGRGIFGRILILAGIVLVACNCTPCPVPPPCPECTPCAGGACPGGTGFEDLTIGTQYHVPDTFTSSGLSIIVLPFQWMNGQWTKDGYAEVKTDPTGSSLNAMYLNNVNLGFTIKSICVTIDFCDYGGNVNFGANGIIKTAQDFQDLMGFDFNGMSFNVTMQPGGSCGVIETKGDLEEFSFEDYANVTLALGGQELFIDNVCPCN